MVRAAVARRRQKRQKRVPQPIPDKGHVVRVYNKGKQLISLQVKPPGGDFFLHEQTIYLRPGQTVKLPKSHINSAQIRNLQARRQIQVIYDSEVAGDK